MGYLVGSLFPTSIDQSRTDTGNVPAGGMIIGTVSRQPVGGWPVAFRTNSAMTFSSVDESSVMA